MPLNIAPKPDNPIPGHSHRFMLAYTTGAIVLYACLLAHGDRDFIHFGNAILPPSLGLICLWTCYRMVRKEALTLCSPLPWFLLAWSVYYAVGSLVYVYGSPETISYLDTLYPVDPQTLLRTNLLNAVALLIVVSTAALLRISRSSGKDPAVHLIHDPFKVAIVFLAIGMPVKYLLEWPYVVGLLDYTLPGVIQYLGSLSGVAQIPLAVASTGKRRLTRWLLWGNLTLELAFGVAILSKLHILLTIIWTCLGFHFIRPNVHRLILTGVLLAIMYASVLSPFINFARAILNRPSAQNLAEVAETVRSYAYAGGEATLHAPSGVQGWWSRLSYSNVQAFAMDQYDQGATGWTFHRIPFVFLPRVFVHDKPIMTPGREFTYTLRGTEHSSTGLGFAAEAYWHGGWLAVLCVCGYVGILFTVLGKICWHAVRSHRWLYTPVICKAVLLGLRPDDWFVPAYIGGVLHVAVMTLVLHVLFRGLVCTKIPPPMNQATDPPTSTRLRHCPEYWSSEGVHCFLQKEYPDKLKTGQ